MLADIGCLPFYDLTFIQQLLPDSSELFRLRHLYRFNERHSPR